MSVRAKFRVVSKTANANDESTFVIRLNAVIANSPENEAFFKATPSGTIELWSTNPKAAEQFEDGKDYYVDFTPAPMPQPEVGNPDTEAEAHAEQAQAAEESTNTQEDTENV